MAINSQNVNIFFCSFVKHRFYSEVVLGKFVILSFLLLIQIINSIELCEAANLNDKTSRLPHIPASAVNNSYSHSLTRNGEPFFTSSGAALRYSDAGEYTTRTER